MSTRIRLRVSHRRLKPKAEKVKPLADRERVPPERKKGKRK